MSALENNDGVVGAGLGASGIKQSGLGLPKGRVEDMELTATETPGGPVVDQAGARVIATGNKEVSTPSSEDLLRLSLSVDTRAENRPENMGNHDFRTVNDSKLSNDDFDSFNDDVESIKTNSPSNVDRLSNSLMSIDNSLMSIDSLVNLVNLDKNLDENLDENSFDITNQNLTNPNLCDITVVEPNFEINIDVIQEKTRKFKTSDRRFNKRVRKEEQDKKKAKDVGRKPSAFGKEIDEAYGKKPTFAECVKTTEMLEIRPTDLKVELEQLDFDELDSKLLEIKSLTYSGPPFDYDILGGIGNGAIWIACKNK